MNEIDFDELDRAVSSVLGGTASNKAPAKTGDNSQSVATKASAVAVEPVSEAGDASVKPGDISDANDKSLVQKRSRGRFMDIVPSTHGDDHRKVQDRVSRQAVSIEPEKDVSENKPVQASTSEQPSLVQSPVESKPAESAHPSGSNPSSSEALNTTSVELEGLDNLLTSDGAADSPNIPFVTDTGVEKRPLGSHSGTDSTADDTSDKPQELNHEMNKAIQSALSETGQVNQAAPQDRTTDGNQPSGEPEQVPPETILPDELRADVVAVESAHVEAAVAPAAASQANVGSIKQQYAEKPSSESQAEKAAMFDTTDYEKSSTKSTKKKSSGWLSVLIVFSLAVLGAGIGAAVYYFDAFGLL